MKILVVQEADWLKRNPHQQHHLMERLSLKGHQIRVIDYSFGWKDEKGFFKPREVVHDYYKIHPQARIDIIRPATIKIPLIIYPTALFYHQREINRQIKEFNPDVVVGFGMFNGYFASKACKSAGIPFIYYWLDVLHFLIPEKSLQGLGKIFENAAIKNSTEVITINHKLEEYVKNLGAKKTKVIGAGIDLEKFDKNMEGSSIRIKYGIKEDEMVLFFMGYLYHFAGLKEVALELDKYENIKLLIVGDGEGCNDLEDITGEHDLGDKIILAGRKPYDEIPEYIAASDICILPAYQDADLMQEIVPIKLYEYMAMGKPVISTALPGIIREFGHNNGISYVKKPEEVPKKALNIDIIVEGMKARKYAEKCDWNEITQQFEDEIKGAISNE